MHVVNRYSPVSLWLVGSALFALLLQPTPLRTVEPNAPVLACCLAQAETKKDRETSCVTLVVRGMMKSKSGAT